MLLPLDPDASATRLRERGRRTAPEPRSPSSSPDSFGRAWRLGTTDVALGVAGVAAVLDLDGRRDSVGYELHATQIAVADEIAGAAQLVMGKLDASRCHRARIAAAAVRAAGSDLVMPRERDLFR